MARTDIVPYLPALLVPVITGIVGGAGLVIKDYRVRRSVDHRTRQVMEKAHLQVQFLNDWVTARQLLGPLEEEAGQKVREYLERSFTSAQEAAAIRQERKAVTLRRLLLLRPLHSIGAHLTRVLFWGALVLGNYLIIRLGIQIATERKAPDSAFTAASFLTIFLFFGASAVFFRTWCVALDEAAKQPGSQPPPNWSQAPTPTGRKKTRKPPPNWKQEP
ncbi:hypothetical protein [Streptomyces sp. N2A]|uniref:hypothetical protein n=1 Tax=Streptomyces sp. N2A TaxID=3073936 RepID=UPI0028700735|nr:hypothetical protein [Streptomyces sp. N2A]